jgi:hypothetical protein
MRTGLVALDPTKFPLALIIPISVANAGAAEPVAPTDGLVAEMVPVIGRGLAALTPTSLPEAFINPISVELVGAGEPFRPTDALEPGEGAPVPVPCPMMIEFAMATLCL